MQGPRRNRRRRLRLRNERWIAALVVLAGVGVLIVGGILVRDMRSAMQHASQMHEGSVAALDLLNDLHYQTQEARRSMLYALTTADSSLQVQYADGSRAADSRIAAIVQEHVGRSRVPEIQEAGRRFLDEWRRYLVVRDGVITLILEGAAPEAVARDLQDGAPAFDRVRLELAWIRNRYTSEASLQLAVLQSASDRSLFRLGLLLAGMLGVAALALRSAHRTALHRTTRKSETRLRQIVASIKEGMFVSDDAAAITLWNAGMERNLGVPSTDAVGRSIDRLPALEQFPQLIEAIRGATVSGRAVVVADLEHSADGAEPRTFEARVFPFEHGSTVFLDDVTERRRERRALEAAKEHAEAASLAKGEFLANMSHELRTPLNGITGMTELTLDTELSDLQREYLGYVQTSADALLAVINDILDFAKIDAGKLELDQQPFDVRTSLERALKTMAPRVHEKGLELVVSIDDGVPDVVVGDQGRLRQVMINLVSNATKFTAAGEICVRVERLDTRDAQGRLLISVSDTGIGIPLDKQALIFEAFTQADGSITRQYGGTGLGLSITKRLIELMGGRIWLDSAVGVGSTFHFEWAFGVSAEASVQPRVDLTDLRVLIVDDNATNRRILCETLTRWRMDPEAVGSGAEALAALREASAAHRGFALMLLDMCMPGMDGIDVAGAAQAGIDPAPGIIMLSSAARAGEAAVQGVVRTLLKPVGRDELLDAIAAVVRPAAALHTHTAGTGAATPIGPLLIVLAEDNLTNQRVAVGILSRLGHTVVVAANGREAIAALERKRPDLILMDVQMPEMGGFEATAAIRLMQAHSTTRTSIVAMTAHATAGDRERCLASGMDGYLAKPIDALELVAEIERVLRAPDPAIR